MPPVVPCHGSQCRKRSGHFWAATSVSMADFRLVRDEGLRWVRASDQRAAVDAPSAARTLSGSPTAATA
ncbi:hypothetical protein [Cereibacter sphaeroides]|uniref:hypothetical protein n=1 Tax=Cereibacter sphaeroides TaxID=1063 RepID=UPI003FA499C5